MSMNLSRKEFMIVYPFFIVFLVVFLAVISRQKLSMKLRFLYGAGGRDFGRVLFLKVFMDFLLKLLFWNVITIMTFVRAFISDAFC